MPRLNLSRRAVPSRPAGAPQVAATLQEIVAPAVPRRVLILVRHAEPPDDESAGRLSERGEVQARLLGERLAGWGLQASGVWHSPSPRAVATATVIARHLPGVPVEVDDTLRECIPCRPTPERMTPEEAAWLDSAVTEEELAEGARHAAAARARWFDPEPGPTDSVEIAVSHGNLIRWLVADLLGAPGSWFDTMDYHAAMWAIIRRSGRRPTLVSANSVGHLPSALRGADYPPELRV